MRIWVRMRRGVRAERVEGGDGRRRGICDSEVRWRGTRAGGRFNQEIMAAGRERIGDVIVDACRWWI